MHFSRVSLILALLAGSAAVCDDAETESYVVRLVVKEGNLHGSLKERTLKVRSDCSLAVELNREGNFLSGGTFDVGGESVPFGTVMKVTVMPREDGRFQVRGIHEDSTFAPARAHVDKTVALRTNRIHFAETMKPGETLRRVLEASENNDLWSLILGKKARHEVWMELTLEGPTTFESERIPD